MKNIFLSALIFCIAACSKEESIINELNVKIGSGVYYPDTLLFNAPDMFSMENAKIESGSVSIVYYYNEINVYNQSGLTYLSNKYFGNPKEEFLMEIRSNEFLLINSKGDTSTYKK